MTARTRASGVRLSGCALPIALSVLPLQLTAQGYYNLDAGRPTRVEDASATPRYSLDLQLVPVRYELYASGARRWRADPKVSYGIAPFTELEIRLPVLVVDPRIAGVGRTAGLGGLAVGGLHAFGLETGSMPAVGLAGEYGPMLGGWAYAIVAGRNPRAEGQKRITAELRAGVRLPADS